jgi:galactose mutarotase-like enzyme
MAGSELRTLRIGEAPGAVLEVLARGATVARFEVTDAHGERRDLGVGYATEEEYERRPHYLGAVVGRSATRVADVVREDHPQVRQAGGLDHTLVVPGEGLRTMAVLRSSVASVEVVSDQPGVQVFTGNGFDGTDRTWTGEPVERHGAVALEPQHFPDSPHHASYPTTVLRPGEERRTEVRWRVSR